MLTLGRTAKALEALDISSSLEVRDLAAELVSDRTMFRPAQNIAQVEAVRVMADEKSEKVPL